MTLGALSLVPAVVAAVAYAWRSNPVPARSVLHVVFDDALDEAPASGVAALWRQHEREHLAGLTAKLRAAAQDDRVVGLLLEVKGPKVGLAQLGELDRAVQAFRRSGKWTGAYLETTGEGGGGDGAFALASLANEVVLSPPGEVHLSGMHAEVPFLADTLARAHVDAHVDKRFEFKNVGNTFTETNFTEAHRASLTALLDDLQRTLSAQIAQTRHVSTEEVARWVEASPFSAEAARARGLVDKLAYWDEVVDRVEAVAGHEDALLPIAQYVPKPPKGRTTPVAYVVGSGEISRGGGGYSPGDEAMTAEDYVDALRQAREDGVKGVLLRIDSPGGSYLASDLIRREVAKTRASNVPVVVSMGDTAASGGYFIAAEADYIVAEAGTVTGSIGVVGVSFAVGRALEDFFGVHVGRYAALDNPGTLDSLRAPNAQQSARMSAQIDRIYNDFVGKVAAARHRRFDEIHAIAKGRVWTGRQAVALGLADEVGGLEAASAYLRRRLQLAEDAPLDLQLYPPPKSTLTLLRDALDVGVRTGGLGHTAVRQLSRVLAPRAPSDAAQLPFGTPTRLP